MSIISWKEIVDELIRVATFKDLERLGDLEQLKGFCEKIDSESFVPFQPEDFGSQIARNIDRYYQVVDKTFEVLSSKKELNPQTKGLRKAPRWQGYSQYIQLNGFGVSIDFLRKLWKSPASIDTPFWCHLKEVKNGKWVSTNRIAAYYASVEATKQDDFYGETYLALSPKPYATLEELAEELADEILHIISQIQSLPE